jgi:hypothetical protein
MRLDWIRDFIRRNVVDTVPDDMDMCLSCGKPSCSAAEFAACRPRLERAAELERVAVDYPTTSDTEVRRRLRERRSIRTAGWTHHPQGEGHQPASSAKSLRSCLRCLARLS